MQLTMYHNIKQKAAPICLIGAALFYPRINMGIPKGFNPFGGVWGRAPFMIHRRYHYQSVGDTFIAPAS